MRLFKVGLAGNRYLSRFRCSTNLRSASGIIAAGLFAAGMAQAQPPSPRKFSQTLLDLPLTSFYDTPSPLPAGKPGELIRSETTDDYNLPFSVSVVRILYHSRSAAGADVAASGVVLFPSDGKPSAGGWPIIAWAHGAAGVGRSCAPSLLRSVGHGPFFSMYVNLGYAVVATDYAGLGTNFPNAFLDSQSNANDLINSIPAARAAVSQLGARWIVIGEAEGGLAAEAVAEKENEVRDPGYLGSVVISGLAGAKEIFHGSPQASSGFMLASLAYGIKTVYPKFQVTDMLTPKAVAAYRGKPPCSEAVAASEVSPTETVKPGWESSEFVLQYFARNRVAKARAYGPILAISSDADQAGAHAAAQAVARMCKQGDRIQWRRYSDPNPARVMGDSVQAQIGWVEARFAGRPATTNCP
jgi:alpha-beta hydrolase superfamily lysophospholipase